MPRGWSTATGCREWLCENCRATVIRWWSSEPTNMDDSQYNMRIIKCKHFLAEKKETHLQRLYELDTP
jgi:hypothetical protein